MGEQPAAPVDDVAKTDSQRIERGLEVGVARLRIDPPAQPVRDGRKDPFGNARPEPPSRRRQAVPKRMVVMQHLLRGESQAVENLLNVGVLVAGRLHCVRLAGLRDRHGREVVVHESAFEPGDLALGDLGP